MRVTKPFGKVRLSVKSGDEVLATAVRLEVAPSEMEKITLKAEKLGAVKGDISLSLEEI